MTRTKKKFYAVALGLKPGIYEKWFGEDGAEAQVKGFPNARYHGFATLKEAKAWLREFQESGAVDGPGPQPRSLFGAEEPNKPKTTKKSGKMSEPEAEILQCKVDPDQELKKGKVIIYTDGACIKNPGPGGYGTVLLYGGKRKELFAGFKFTTNNRMELSACIAGLKALKHPCSVILFSDSRYVVNGMKKGWARRWQRKGWMRSKEKAAENADLWAQLLELGGIHDVEFIWIRGHAGQPENERCDQLANQAALDRANQCRDIAFETGQTRVQQPGE